MEDKGYDVEWTTCPVSADALPMWATGEQVVFEPHGGSKFLAVTREQADALTSILATLAAWSSTDDVVRYHTEALDDLRSMIENYQTITA